MALKEFVPRQHSGALEDDFVSIRKNGSLYFPEKLLNKYGIRYPKQHVLYIDDENEQLGVRFFCMGDPCVSIRARCVTEDASGYFIDIKGVLRHFNIEVKQASRHKAMLSDGLVVVYLGGLKQ